MTFSRIDPATDELIECGAKTVHCTTPGCINEGVGIEVADDPDGAVQCGPCEQWIIAPNEDFGEVT